MLPVNDLMWPCSGMGDCFDSLVSRSNTLSSRKNMRREYLDVGEPGGLVDTKLSLDVCLDIDAARPCVADDVVTVAVEAAGIDDLLSYELLNDDDVTMTDFDMTFSFDVMGSSS